MGRSENTSYTTHGTYPSGKRERFAARPRSRTRKRPRKSLYTTLQEGSWAGVRSWPRLPFSRPHPVRGPQRSAATDMAGLETTPSGNHRYPSLLQTALVVKALRLPGFPKMRQASFSLATPYETLKKPNGATPQLTEMRYNVCACAARIGETFHAPDNS